MLNKAIHSICLWLLIRGNILELYIFIHHAKHTGLVPNSFYVLYWNYPQTYSCKKLCSAPTKIKSPAAHAPHKVWCSHRGASLGLHKDWEAHETAWILNHHKKLPRKEVSKREQLFSTKENMACSTYYSKFNQTPSLEGPHWQQSRITCTFSLKLFLEIFLFADVKSTLLFQTAIRLNHQGG